MARLTQDKTAAAFDKRIANLEEGIALRKQEAVEFALKTEHLKWTLRELKSLRAELLDDATDEEGGE